MCQSRLPMPITATRIISTPMSGWAFQDASGCLRHARQAIQAAMRKAALVMALRGSAQSPSALRSQYFGSLMPTV